MKKLWLPVLVVFIWLLLFVAGPWYAGGKVEERFDALLLQVNSNSILKFEKVRYDHGLFSSETDLSVSVNLDMFGPMASQLGELPNAKPIILKGKVEHGPLFLNDGVSFAVGKIKFQPEVTEDHLKEISKIFGENEPLDINMQFNWDDSISTSAALMAFSIPEEGITSEEINFSVDLTDNNQRVVMEFDWGGGTELKPNQKQGTGKLGKIHFSSDSVLALEDLWVGDMKASIDSLSFNDMGMEGQINNLGFAFKTSLDGSKQFVNGTGGYTLDKVNVNGQDYAEDFKFILSFGNIHAESVQKLTKTIQEAQQAGGSFEAMQMAMTMQLMGIVPEMVKKGMSFSIDALDAKVMGEQVKSSLKIEVAEGTDVTQGMAAIAGISATADISVSKALLDMFPQFANPDMVQGLLMQGLIVEEAGEIKAHAEFKDGQLTVNGNPMPIPGLSM